MNNLTTLPSFSSINTHSHKQKHNTAHHKPLPFHLHLTTNPDKMNQTFREIHPHYTAVAQ
eukprot:m.75462 g.75462  ORF g.75462 m.75462 type:complete len:60 (-) comp12452_c0_seq1:1460-1639(-)